MNLAPMTSGQLATAAGVNIETLRFYERRGLLPEPTRTPNGHRRFGPEALERLRLIKRGQALGFALPDIAALIEGMSDPHANCEDVCATVQAKLVDLDRLLAELRTRRRRLVRLRDACPQSRPLSECPIVEELVAKPIPEKTSR